MIIKIDDIKLLEKFSNYIIMDDPFLNCYGYYVENKLVSFITFSIQYDRAELNYIWTDSNSRKKGYASKLLNFMFEKCYNLINITLEVNVNNKSAINLYRKYGFNIVGIRKRYYSNGDDAALMMKEMK